MSIFDHKFVLDVQPANAVLSICAFNSASITINGHNLSNIKTDGHNWKVPRVVAVSRWLQPGTNDLTVCVTNNNGPPALWLRLQSEEFSMGSDESWRVASARNAWRPASRASMPVTLPDWSPLYNGNRTMDSLRRLWPVIALFCAASLALVWCLNRWWSRRFTTLAGIHQHKPVLILLVIIIVARVALFINDVSALPHAMGFDATAHEAYIRFIQEKDALPLPNDGWEMHQPPLYYLGCATLLNLVAVFAGSDDAVIPLRAVNGILGLIECWLVLLCLRRLFPKNPAAQVVGLLVAAFLPPHLYLSMYVTNDPLTGVLVTLAFYLFLRLLQLEKENGWFYAGIGVALGAAMLSKLSAVLVIPIFFAAVALHLMARKRTLLTDWCRSVGVMAILCALTCGWHYARVWMQIGALPLPNSQTDPVSAWWQDPGFRTGSYYLHFGQILVSPLFSGLHSFANGIYSTLWGDGLISGKSELVFRPPWNYDLMNVGYLFSLALTLFALTGLVIAIKKMARTIEPEWFLVLGSCFMFGVGIVYLTLSSPCLATVKAFYAIPALVPFCALIAAGWVWLAQKGRICRAVLWVILLVWTVTNYTTYWIRSSNFETWRGRAIVQLQQQHAAEAIENIGRALQLNPSDPDSHCILAEALLQQNQTSAAIQQYEEALRIRPDSPDTLNDLADVLCNGGKAEADRAVQLAERACEMTDYRQVRLVVTLAAAYDKSGQSEAAVTAAQKACDLAAQTGDAALIEKSQQSLEYYQSQEATKNRK